MSASSARPGFHLAKVGSKKLVSTVCVFDLHVPTLKTFLPGQWVDFMLPRTAAAAAAAEESISAAAPWVGGFSFASIPEDLPMCTLAVKRWNQAPAAIWVHNSMKPQDMVEVRVGGTCVWKPDTTDESWTRPLVLIAGGIGISPILSIYRSYLLHRADNQDVSAPLHLFYSVSTEAELVFGDAVVDLYDTYGDKLVDSLMFTLTQQSSWGDGKMHSQVAYRTGRQLASFLNDLNLDSLNDATYYICGPCTMIDDTIRLLKAEGVEDGNIRYEKWW